MAAAAQGPDVVAYNKLMNTLLKATGVIEPDREAEPAARTLIDLYPEISTRYLSLVDREQIFDSHKGGNRVRGSPGCWAGPRHHP